MVTRALACAALPTALTIHLYCHRTSPPLNILLYNAIGGSGDELYGVEPLSYYLRNLLLNMGAAWPLAVLSPLPLLAEYVTQGYSLSTRSMLSALILSSLAALWLGVLFSRPHKVGGLHSLIS